VTHSLLLLLLLLLLLVCALLQLLHSQQFELLWVVGSVLCCKCCAAMPD
jgi:hypothetical protein